MAKTNSALHGPGGVVVRVSDDYKTATVEGPVEIISGLVDGMARGISLAAHDERRRAEGTITNPNRKRELRESSDRMFERASEWRKFALRISGRVARRWK